MIHAHRRAGSFYRSFGEFVSTTHFVLTNRSWHVATAFVICCHEDERRRRPACCQTRWPSSDGRLIPWHVQWWADWPTSFPVPSALCVGDAMMCTSELYAILFLRQDLRTRNTSPVYVGQRGNCLLFRRRVVSPSEMYTLQTLRFLSGWNIHSMQFYFLGNV